MIDIQKVKTQLSTIDKIYLISDVHIRNLKRHVEYDAVFNRLYEYINDTKTENSIIVLGGDIVHAKTDMTPELIQMVQHFFKNCADLCYTVLITGNHDCNLNNRSRMDALAPIVNALSHPKLIYLRDSGVYNIADKHFTVMSVFDKPIDFIRADQFTADYKIALHHGAVDRAVTDTGHVLTNEHVTTSLFSGYDLVLLGDIHVPGQYLNAAKTIAYPGSLIQQSYGESLGHGILVWDTINKTSKFVEIFNDYGFYTLDIVNGQYTLPDNLPKNLRLRLRVKNTSNADIKTILSDIKVRYNVLETPIQKIANIGSSDFNTLNKINIGDVRDIEFQNHLLFEYLKQLNNDDSIIDGIKHVNRKCNTLLQKMEVSRNTVWIPKKFTFSNMFSYGENNVIDFTKLKGLYGIFAANATGKSTLFESLAFCIFDKCNRTSRAEQILNNKSDHFTSKFEFDINNKSYVIERTGVRKKDHVRVDVKFYEISESGEYKSLNGKERSDTNKIIRSYLGSYEDFVLTSLSVQNNNTGFIDMGQRERKELLAQFLDSDIFEALYKIANEESKDIASLIKDLSKQNLDTQLANVKKRLDSTISEEQTLSNDKLNKEREINDTFESINELASKLIPLNKHNIDIDSLHIQLNKLESNLVVEQNNKRQLEEQISNMSKDLVEYTEKLSLVDVNEISEQIKRKSALQAELDKLNTEKNSLDIHIQHKEVKMSNLKSLEYDENCTYCMNNVFVKDAITTKESLGVDIESRIRLTRIIQQISNELLAIQTYEKKKASYDTIVNHIKTMESIKLRLDNDKLRCETNITNINSQIQTINSDIRYCEDHRDAIIKNAQISAIILDKRSVLSKLKSELQIIEKHLNALLYARSSDIVKREQLTNELNRLNELQKDYKYYQLYMDAFSRDGIPYQLISKALPKIESEVNNILSQLVDYQIHFNTDGKNINTYIVYDTDKFWPLELASGMEKFISSLAIRTSLINVSSLPRPPFLVIDEGLGNLDAENLNNMYVLFDYLKTQFEYMIVISHIDSIRDMVDSVIEITKLQNRSSIVYE